MKGEGRDWEQGRTWSHFVEVQYWRGKPEIRNILDFIPSDIIGAPGGDTNLAWKTIDDFQRCTEDSLSLCLTVETRSLQLLQ